MMPSRRTPSRRSHTTTGTRTIVQIAAPDTPTVAGMSRNTMDPTTKSSTMWIWAAQVRGETGAVRICTQGALRLGPAGPTSAGGAPVAGAGGGATGMVVDTTSPYGTPEGRTTRSPG